MDATQPEVWRPIPSLEGHYEASSWGRIRSTTRMTNSGSGRRLHHGRVLSQSPTTQFKYMGVRVGIGANRRAAYVHRLVCEAFHGAPSPGQQVRHLNGIKTDNRPENLCWGTLLENAADRTRHGTNVCQNTYKTHCPRKHLLQLPNLRMSEYRRHGYRTCRACEMARIWVKNHPGADFETEAARYYERYRPEADAA